MRKLKIIETLELIAARQLNEFTDESVKEINVHGIVEFIEGKYRGAFFDEVYRVLTKDGTAKIAVPYWSSVLGIQDFRYAWPPFSEQSFLYFNRKWREANNIKTKMRCDFDFTYGFTLDPETEMRNLETQRAQIKRNNNAAQILHVHLTKAPSC